MIRILPALVVATTPSLALACSVCGQGRPNSEGAYLLMTGIMSALPLALMGCFAVWIVRRARKHDRDEQAPPGSGVQ